MKDWTKETHHEYQLANRYLTAAQRTFDRARRTIWQYRGLLRMEAREQPGLVARSAGKLLKSGQPDPVLFFCSPKAPERSVPFS
jgi:hypothetical protein